MKRLGVAVVGCGPAGAAAALLLHRDGHRVTVYERVVDLKPIGAGILLQPTGLRVIRELGLEDDVRAVGSKVHRLWGETARGKRVMDLRYGHLAPDLHGIGIHRGTLFSMLHKAVESEGIELRLGVEVAEIDPHSGRIGNETFDIIVVADGARSRLRPQELVLRDKEYAWGAVWTCAPDTAGTFEGVLSQVYEGAQRMAGFLPSGRLNASDDFPLVSVFWSLKLSDADLWRERGLDSWKNEVLRLAPHATSLLTRIDAEHVVVVPYYDSRMKQWHYGKTAYLGDAAHAMSPQLGQGANLALLDALALREVLRNDEELGAFTYIRKRHIRYYQWASSVLTPLFQEDRPFYPRLRNALLPIACGFPLTRKIMLKTLAGLRSGPLADLAMPGVERWLS